MLDTKHFARNSDGSIKTKEPCQTTGCRYPNWHLCFGPTSPNGPIAMKKSTAENFMEKFADPTRRTKITEAARAKRAENLEAENKKNFERDKEIVRDFDTGQYTKVGLQDKYELTDHKLRSILTRRGDFIES